MREHAGNSALWLGCAVIGALTAVAHLVSGPARERRATALRRAADRQQTSLVDHVPTA